MLGKLYLLGMYIIRYYSIISPIIRCAILYEKFEKKKRINEFLISKSAFHNLYPTETNYLFTVYYDSSFRTPFMGPFISVNT